MYKAILASQNIWTLLGRFFLRNIHITKFILELESQLIILFSKSWWYDSYIRFVSQHYTNLNRTTSTSLLCRHFYVVLTPKLFFFYSLCRCIYFLSPSLCALFVFWGIELFVNRNVIPTEQNVTRTVGRTICPTLSRRSSRHVPRNVKLNLGNVMTPVSARPWTKESELDVGTAARIMCIWTILTESSAW